MIAKWKEYKIRPNNCSFFLKKFLFLSQVETCQEKIISLELKDPITNITINESQLLQTKLPETVTIIPSDDENSSIITVRSNDENNFNENLVHLHLAGDVNATPEASSGTFLTAVQHHQPLNVIDNSENMQTIVEVVNPLITGDGYANKIAIGRSSDCQYSSLNENDMGNVADDEFDSLAFNAASDELSLSDKMKNVLQELVENERIKKLNTSQSESEEEDSDENNDTDDDENDPLQYDDINIEIDINPSSNVDLVDAKEMEEDEDEENGNSIGDVNVDRHQDSDNNDDIKNANRYDNFVYENPNFLMAGDEFDASTSQQNVSIRNQRDEKLKEKLLSELNVQSSTIFDKSHDSNLSDENRVAIESTKSNVKDLGEEDSSISLHEDIPSAPTSPTETSSKSNSSNSAIGRRKKRKSKSKKK